MKHLYILKNSILMIDNTPHLHAILITHKVDKTYTGQLLIIIN
jgi:hypothetical protein